MKRFYHSHCENPHLFLPWTGGLFLYNFEDLNPITSQPALSRLQSLPFYPVLIRQVLHALEPFDYLSLDFL